MASNFGKRDEVAERKSLEKGHHLCRKVTAALQREMSRGLASSSSSSTEPDFTSASAPVIVYSLENHVLDVGTRRKLAFKCAACIALCFCFATCNVLRQVRCSRYDAGCLCYVVTSCLCYDMLTLTIACEGFATRPDELLLEFKRITETPQQ